MEKFQRMLCAIVAILLLLSAMPVSTEADY